MTSLRRPGVTLLVAIAFAIATAGCAANTGKSAGAAAPGNSTPASTGKDDASAARPAASAPEAVRFTAVPGGTVQFEVGVPDELRRLASQVDNSPVRVADVAVAVPAGFDPHRSWPILVVSATADPGYTGNRRWMRAFAAPALAAGWVVVAADPAPPYGDAADDDVGLRYGLIKTALAALQATWPGAATWPLAFGGFSGGAKISGTLGLISSIDGRVPIGMFLGGCNAATPAFALRESGRHVPAFLEVPIFLSSGNDDPVATPDRQQEVEDFLWSTGFKHVKLESYDGEHELYAAHVRAALDWFKHGTSP